MFQFPRLAHTLTSVTIISDGRVSPFGHPGITACVQLPLAYRSLPRPSSPPCTQASPVYILSLDQISDSNKHNTTRNLTNDSFMLACCDSPPCGEPLQRTTKLNQC